MTRKYIIVADDSIKGFDEGIEKLEREWGAEEIEPCEDCIRRAEVYDIITRLFTSTEMTNEIYKNTMQLIKDVPSVTPQRQKGENE